MTFASAGLYAAEGEIMDVPSAFKRRELGRGLI
jgi:hypothetical protein